MHERRGRGGLDWRSPFGGRFLPGCRFYRGRGFFARGRLDFFLRGGPARGLGFAGDGIRLRTYYAVTLPQAGLDGLVLGEGADLAAFEAERLLAMPRVVPYDAFALWMHHARWRIASSHLVAGHAC